MKSDHLMIVFCLLMFNVHNSFADSPVQDVRVLNGSSLGFAIDNDSFVGRDRNYTNGIRLSWMSEAAENGQDSDYHRNYSQFLKDAFDFVPGFGSEFMQHNASISIRQIMYTPEDIDAVDVVPNESPYAGVLSIGSSLFAWDHKQFRQLELSIGVIGPDSGAESTQKLVHELIGESEPRGWDNQVGQRTFAALSYTSGHRVKMVELTENRSWDLMIDYSLTFSGLEDVARVGATYRWGRNLPNSFGNYSVGGGSESALLGLNRNNNSGWYLFLALDAVTVSDQYIEKAVRNTHNLQARDSLASVSLGASYYHDRFQLGVSLHNSSSRFKQTNPSNFFGSIYSVYSF